MERLISVRLFPRMMAKLTRSLWRRAIRCFGVDGTNGPGQFFSRGSGRDHGCCAMIAPPTAATNAVSSLLGPATSMPTLDNSVVRHG
jgi:hypothetical protein